MKRKLYSLLLSSVLVSTVFTGCVKIDNEPATTFPSTFTLMLPYASGFYAGLPTHVQMGWAAGTTGTYTVTYSLSGANTAAGLTTTVNLINGSGRFVTAPLANNGDTRITVTNISNSTGSAVVSNGNFADAHVGAVTFTRNGYNYYSDVASGSLLGSDLTIVASRNDSGQTAHIYINGYSVTPTSYPWTYSVAGTGVTYSAGSIIYGSHGVTTVTSTTGYLSGTFTCKFEDSSSVSGQFTVPTP